MSDLSDAVMLCEVCRDAHKIGECPGLPMSFDAWWNGAGFVDNAQTQLLKGWCKVAWEAGQDAKAEEHRQWLKAVTTRRVDPCVAAYDRSPTEAPAQEERG